MKKLLAFICAVMMSAVLCSCEDVPYSQPDSSEIQTTTESTEITSEHTGSESEDTTEEHSKTEQDASQARIETQSGGAADTTEESISVNEDAVKALTYSDWTQSNANAKNETVKRIIMYIESKGDEVTLDAREIVAQLNSLQTASETDSLVTLTYEILGIEEK